MFARSAGLLLLAVVRQALGTSFYNFTVSHSTASGRQLLSELRKCLAGALRSELAQLD